MKLKRIIIYPKDVQRITGRSERYGRKLIREIKSHLQKDEHQYVTVDEFAEYTGIEKTAVMEYL